MTPVAEKCRNRQFRKTKIAGDAGEGVAQSMQCDVLKPRHAADGYVASHEIDVRGRKSKERPLFRPELRRTRHRNAYPDFVLEAFVE